MRFQWNQLGRKENTQGLKTDKYHSGYICPCCGLEIYSEWYVAYSIDGSFEKTRESDYEDLRDEAVAFSNLCECPCCSGKLIHDPMYFIQVEFLGFGFDRSKDYFFKSDKCRYVSDSLLGIFDTITTVDEMFNHLYRQQRGLETKYAKKRISEHTMKYDIPVSDKAKNDVVCAIGSDAEKIKEYLLNIINIEKNIQLLSARLFSLHKLNYKATKEAVLSKFYPTLLKESQERNRIAEKIEQLQHNLCDCLNETALIQQQREQLFSAAISVPEVQYPTRKPIEPSKPFYDTPGFFNKKKIMSENKAKSEKYNNDIALYNEELAEYYALVDAADREKEQLRKKAVEERNKQLQIFDNKIEEYKTKCAEISENIETQKLAMNRKQPRSECNANTPAIDFKTSVDEEILKAEALLADLYKQKRQLYGFNIVFGKYHDFVAITSFYEYLLSGRCETLAGVNGCYNLYEEELRSNIIINKLDNIITSLDKIKGNQYMLFSQLTAINTELHTLNSTTNTAFLAARDAVESLLYHSATVAHNSSIIARNSSVTAENSIETVNNSFASAHNSAIAAYNSAVTAHYTKLNAEIASSARYISMICW